MAKQAHLSIRVSPEEKAALEKLAAQRDVSVGQLVRRALQGISANVEPQGPTAARRAALPAGGREREIRWLQTHARQLQLDLPGEWVIIEGEELISHGTDFLDVLAQARRRGVQIPFVERIPESVSGAWMGL